MKFLLDKVAVGTAQWKLIADTHLATAWVLDGESVYEFGSRHEALRFMADEYRRTADLRSMQPGQSYTITMSDGSSKMVQVQNQTPDGVQVMDPSSGMSMMIPHVMPGAEPKPAQNPQQNATSQTPKPNQPQNSPATPVGPENQTDRTYSLGLGDLRVRASEFGKTPNNCKHDGTHLNRKNPSDAEKACPECGMVYAASKKAKIISEHKECVNCGGHGSLNDSGECAKCSRRKAFRTWKNRDRMVRAHDLIKQADAPFAGQQAQPSADVANEGQTIQRDEKSPSDFAEEPESQKPGDPNAKRQLTPHEIIEEAESLIRNALVKGVRIGAAELSEYMGTYYNNPMEELMQGIALAWQKVQYEESTEGGDPGDPNAPQGEGFGPQAPTTPEEAQQMAPKNGPIRTKSF